MPPEHDLEQRLKAEAEEIIQAIMARKKPAGKNSLKDIENLAQEAGRGFRERVLDYLAQEESQAEEEAVCEECGKRMQSRGKRKRQLVTEAGEVKIERGQYVCPKCGKTIFPPG
jgi:uncharacterized protein with PIN domain